MPEEHTNTADWVYCATRDSWFTVEFGKPVGYGRVGIRWIDGSPRQIVSWKWLRYGVDSGAHIWAAER